MSEEAAPPAPEATADDGLFPSGPWRGFYDYRRDPTRHRMDLELEFRSGRVDGRGSDDIGIFVIAGTYDRESLVVTWRKTYPGSHDVAYRGFREGRGIWGTWDIGTHAHGGFHIWPKGSGELDASKEEVERLLPAVRPAPAPLQWG